MKVNFGSERVYLKIKLLLFLSSLSLMTNMKMINCQTYNDQSTTLYVTSPSCATYRCEVIKHRGDKLNINWLNAPPGTVKIQLVSESNNGPTYTIKNQVEGTQPNCYHGENGKRPCGKYDAIIPNNWASGKYSVQVISTQTGKTGYTDIVKII